MLALVLVVGACGSGNGNEDSAPEPETSQPPVEPGSPALAPMPAAKCPAPVGFSDVGVQVGQERNATAGEIVSFGLPLPRGAVTDAGTVSITTGGVPVDATVLLLLEDYGSEGGPAGVRSVLVQIPASVLGGDCGQVDVTWEATAAGSVGGSAGSDPVPYADVSFDSEEAVDTAERTIEERDGQAVLVETSTERRVLFTAREPAVLATFPDGYLAATGILGRQVAASRVGGDMAGLAFVSEQVTPFGLSAMFQETYALNPVAVIGPDDLDEDADITGYEAWLYDRCATFLLFAVHTGNVRFLREGYRSCSYYAGKIELEGDNRGIFTGKPEPDPKYSHLRGLYAYYALTGDEAALEAGEAIAERWLEDEDFVGPYRDGHISAPDDLWTERLLATSIEGLYYGHLLTGDREYLEAVEEMVATAHRHITGDEAALAEINPGRNVSPQRRLGWWFNAALEQFALLQEAGITMTELHPGVIQP